MSDWMDFLEGLSGGASGIVQGLTAGAKPFDAWEGVRTKDIANDRGEITNRDLELLQDARENAGYDYYGNKIGAEDTGFRQRIAAGEYDIFGNQRKLALADYLSDPEGAFQQGLRETGWTPGSPEYREWLAEAMAQFDPSGAVAAYDKFNIPGIQNRNLNEQASLEYIQSRLRELGPDPEATIVRRADGTIVVLSGGEEHELPGNALARLASMMNNKDGPEGAIRTGITQEIAIQKANADIYEKYMKVRGDITPTQQVQFYREQGTRANQLLLDARKELAAAEKAANDPLMDPETAAAAKARVVAAQDDVRKAQQYLQEIAQRYNQIMTTGRVPLMERGGGMPMRPSAGPGASVTTRPRPGGMAARAAGMADVPWGMSSAGPAYPPRRVNPQDTGIRPISDAGPGDDLLAFLQLIGAA